MKYTVSKPLVGCVKWSGFHLRSKSHNNHPVYCNHLPVEPVLLFGNKTIVQPNGKQVAFLCPKSFIDRSVPVE